MRRLPILTNSAEKVWRDCARKYKISQIDLVRPIIDADALQFGTRIHLALEAWWKAAKEDPAKVCGECDRGTVRLSAGTDSAEDAECIYCAGTGLIGPEDWLRAALSAIADDPDPYRRATCEAMMVGYHHRWSAMKWEGAPYDGAPIEVLAVEQEFTGPLLNPETGSASKSFQRGGKIDVLIRVRTSPVDAECPVWVGEHKSSSEDFAPGSPYRARLRLDTQVSGYHVGARLLGHSQVAGVLYDVLGKPAFRPKKATPPEQRKWTKATAKEPSRLYSGQRLTDETPEEYQERVIEEIAQGGWFARFEVVRLREEERRAAQDTWQRAQEIRDAVRLGRYPRNASACTKFGRACEYLPICLGEATANDGTRYRKAETAHEELGDAREEREAA